MSHLMVYSVFGVVHVSWTVALCWTEHEHEYAFYNVEFNINIIIEMDCDTLMVLSALDLVHAHTYMRLIALLFYFIF